jgi:hypothetical protein
MSAILGVNTTRRNSLGSYATIAGFAEKIVGVVLRFSPFSPR